MQTSSGDTIDLKMYDEKSAEIMHAQDETTSTTTLSLSHAYGYNFSYKGNGIDEADKKEIAQAMKMIQPMLNQYFNNIKDSSAQNADTINTAFDINSLLPQTSNHNTRNFINDGLLKAIDQTLDTPQNQTNEILKHAKKLFDALLKQADHFERYI